MNSSQEVGLRIPFHLLLTSIFICYFFLIRGRNCSNQVHARFVWVGAFGQTSLRRRQGKGSTSRESCISSHRRRILVQSDSEAERLEVSVFESSGTIFTRLHGTFPNEKMALGCVCITWNAGLSFCQPAPSWAWGETWLYQKPVMETQVCDWWRYHLPPGQSSVRCLINDLMRVFTSKRKWHESRADSGCNTSRIRWLTLDFYLYLQQIWAFLVCINAYFKQSCILEGGIINQILA